MRAFFLLLLLLPCGAIAAEPAPVKGSLTLRHVSADVWQADYRFSEAVDAVDFGPAVVNFRREAWTVATPGVELAGDADNELLRSTGAPFKSLRVAVHQYNPWAHNAYVPMDRHSDGGTAIYLGHFMGRVKQHGAERALLLHIRLQGLRGETTFLPEEANRDLGVYAYFGPQKIPATGALRVLIDPATPAWIRESLAETASKLAVVYARELGRPAPATLALIVGANGLAKPGYSIKGGAMPGQIVYTLEGSDLAKGSPQGRHRMQQLAAHELAHVWQMQVARGGIGDTQPWVHEGGAEVLSLQALEAAGMWTHAEVVELTTKMQGECRESEAKHAADPSLPLVWREHYTCGLMRFGATGVDAFTLWKRLMARTEATGEPYSESMVEAVVAEGAGSAQATSASPQE
ncbi:hypothetical protein [Arenimonas oryziterrae]|uniref:Peptidase MA-like domain-containing protein n=1 Tax=Arenimonas oryziterrae DSM 21050 = YC6267 TaxID=1121015 RepID=A0A091AVB2_9GAMM|nr:hypothetical protein [Arenimonas oryziterrae]KFN42604.1 hypothetical protein N789_13265 [Arenimonas oryziterrae DSM 21050 = YC6267]